MRRLITAGAITLTLVSAGAARAQLPVELELRGGAAFPMEDFGPTELKTGAGAAFNVNVRFMPHLAAYAGWDWYRFTPKAEFGDFDLENTGYVLGLQFQHPVYRKVGYWVRGGALYAHVEIEDGEGDVTEDSGHEFGWEAGGGASIPFGGRLTLTPGVRYRSLSVELGEAATSLDLSYLAAEIGFQIRLGARPATTALVR